MKTETIERILKQHSVPYYIENDRIYVDSMLAGTELFAETEDVTDWTLGQLRDWLGY